MLFVIIKIVRPDTRVELPDIMKNLEAARMSLLKHDTPKANLQIAEWMNKISISLETY